MMVEAINRFSGRVENYVKYRPGYPTAIVELLVSECGLSPDSVIADIGSGTGILSELFLKNGNHVFGVEPNAEMRTAAEGFLKSYKNFTSVKGRAEATTLADNNVDLVVAAQAFHWFDQQQARAEFERILKAGNWISLIWNERRLDSPFLRDFENLFLEYGTDYARVRHENTQSDIAAFFAPGRFTLASFENFQQLDLEGLTGRVLSASYTPGPDDPNQATMLDELGKIFSAHEIRGTVVIEYDSRVYYGHLNETASDSAPVNQ